MTTKTKKIFGKRKDGQFYLKGIRASKIRELVALSRFEAGKVAQREQVVFDGILVQSMGLGKSFVEAVDDLVEMTPGQISEFYHINGEEAIAVSRNAAVLQDFLIRRKESRKGELVRRMASDKANVEEGHSHVGMMQTEYCPVCQKYLKREDIP